MCVYILQTKYRPSLTSNWPLFGLGSENWKRQEESTSRQQRSVHKQDVSPWRLGYYSPQESKVRDRERDLSGMFLVCAENGKILVGIFSKSVSR